MTQLFAFAAACFPSVESKRSLTDNDYVFTYLSLNET